MDQQQPGMTISPQKPETQPAAVAPANAEAPHPDLPPAPSSPQPQWQFTADTGSEASHNELPHRPSHDGIISWTSSEFIAHDKSPSWYGMLGGGALVVAAIVFVLTRDKISTSVVIIAALVLGFYATRKPRELEYKLDEGGITIGTKFYVYDLFKSFSVVDEGAISGIVLMPLKRFMPQLTIYYAPSDEDKIVDVLADRLPMEEHKADLVDSLMRRIRF